MLLRTFTGFICTLVLSAGAHGAIVEWKMADVGNGHLYEVYWLAVISPERMHRPPFNHAGRGGT